MDKIEAKALKEMEKEMSFKKNGNIANFIKENLSKIMVLIMSISYVFYGLFLFKTKDRTIVEILGSISVSLFMGTSIYLCLRTAGLSDARRNDLFKKVAKDFDDTVSSVANDCDKIPAFCNLKNELSLEEEKKRIIEKNFMNYKSWKKGFYDDEIVYNKLTPKQQIALKVVHKVRIKGINPSDLVNSSIGLTEKDRKKYGEFGKSERDYKRQKTMSELGLMLLMGIVFGYFGLEQSNTGNLATIVWNIFQVIMWIGNGIIKYFDARNFILNDYCELNLRKKIGLLNEFKSILNNNPSLLKNYSDDVEETEENKNGSNE